MKTLIVIIALLLAMAFLVACGASGAVGADANPPEAETTTTTTIHHTTCRGRVHPVDCEACGGEDLGCRNECIRLCRHCGHRLPRATP